MLRSSRGAKYCCRWRLSDLWPTLIDPTTREDPLEFDFIELFAVGTLADRIIRYPARSLDDIVIKFAALEWALLDEGVVMDWSVRRQIIAFHRNLISLGAHAGRA